MTKKVQVLRYLLCLLVSSADVGPPVVPFSPDIGSPAAYLKTVATVVEGKATPLLLAAMDYFKCKHQTYSQLADLMQAC